MRFYMPLYNLTRYVQMKFLSRLTLRWFVAGLLFFLSAEITCRIGDWTQAGVPLWATPDRERDLVITDGNIQRGRPHGSFKKWHLNEYGFRGPSLSMMPAQGCTRVMVLGASESFGMYESENKEYPAQLRTLLGQHKCFDVVNASMVGMTVRSMLAYWEHWGSRFTPHIAVIYPSPLFYLNITKCRRCAQLDVPPASLHGQVPHQEHETLQVRSRLLMRLQDYITLPDFLQQYRDQRELAAKIVGQPEQWFFRELPGEQLQWYTEDLEALAQAIEARGVRPILLTPALRAKFPPDARDLQDLERGRVHTPRALPRVIVEFARAAATRIIALGQQHGWSVIDVGTVMNGERAYFGDLVHFNDDGALVIANRIARHILLLDQAQVPPIPPIVGRRLGQGRKG
jgi:hypothetical protein